MTTRSRGRYPSQSNEKETEDDLRLPDYNNGKTETRAKPNTKYKTIYIRIWLVFLNLKLWITNSNTYITFSKLYTFFTLSNLKKKVNEVTEKVKSRYNYLRAIDTESNPGINETVLQIKMKYFIKSYTRNLKISLLATLCFLFLLVRFGDYLIQSNELIIDKNGNAIKNPFLFRLNGRIYTPNLEFESFLSDSLWFKNNENRSIDNLDFERGYYEAEIYSRGIMNVTLNQTKEILYERCGKIQDCSCAGLTQFGINKNIFIMKDDQDESIILYGFNLISKSDLKIKTIIQTRVTKHIEAPSYFSLEYYNENGSKVRYHTKTSVQAICIQSFQNMNDLSFFSTD
jgi:hypothetical protein